MTCCAGAIKLDARRFPAYQDGMDDHAEAIRARFAAIVGPGNLLVGAEETARYSVEWRGLYGGRPLAVARPGTTAEVAAIVRLAAETGTPIVPQSGNTGLVGGQTPDASERELVLSLERLDRIRAIDPGGGTMVAEAGVVLSRVQEAAESAGMLFPLSLGSQGSCRIGGNISTNAGGTSVLAYGNMRSLVLGLEVVLPSGAVWDGLRGLMKDNAGYDLKHLFIGAEGTLGVITAAVLRLHARPRGRAVAFCGLPTPGHALALLRRAREGAGGALTGFELMPRLALDFCLRHLPGARDPLAGRHPWYVLVEVVSGDGAEEAQSRAQAILDEALSAGELSDAAIAHTVAQQQSFWRLRHDLSEIQKHEGASLKHDVAVAVADIPAFLDRAAAAVAAAAPGCRPLPFGHMGDGNIHFNVSQPIGADPASFLALGEEVSGRVHGLVAAFGGSVAAEHGIGRAKRDLLRAVRSPVEIDLMRSVKGALDPRNIMNPGRVL